MAGWSGGMLEQRRLLGPACKLNKQGAIMNLTEAAVNNFLAQFHKQVAG
jgi:hypothetical protein